MSNQGLILRLFRWRGMWHTIQCANYYKNTNPNQTLTTHLRNVKRHVAGTSASLHTTELHTTFRHIFITAVHRVAWIPLRFLFWLLADFRVFGLQHLEGVSSPVIFISNHQGPFDPFLIGIALPWGSPLQGIQWLTQDDQFKRLIRRYTLRIFGAFPGKIRTGYETALENPLRLLNEGASVGVFPEWCYDDILDLERIQRVVPAFAERTRRPVVPVFLFGVDHVTWRKLFQRRLSIHVAFGMPYFPDHYSSSRIYDDVNTQFSRTRYTHLNDFIHTEERKFWEEYGSFYKYLERADAYHELVSDFEKLLPDALLGIWVDLGSGSGQIVELLAPRRAASASIIASDHNETMLSQLRARFPSGVTVREIDLVHRLPFEDGSLDGVTANLVLSYVVHHEGKFGSSALRTLLIDIHRFLKPGGMLVWSTPKFNVHFIMTFFASLNSIMRSDQRENIRYGWRILRQALRIEDKGRRGVYHFLPQEDLVRILGEIGFRNIRVSRTMAHQVYLIRCER